MDASLAARFPAYGWALSPDSHRIDINPAQRDTMMQLTGRRTVPQIFIGSTHVGGCDDLVALDQQGQLVPLLQAGG